MRAGKKDKRIQIQILSTAKSSFGSSAETWGVFKNVWAQVSYLQGDERFAAAEVTATVDITFKIDYIAALLVPLATKNYRIKYNGNLYNIIYAAEVGRREALEITAKARGV